MSPLVSLPRRFCSWVWLTLRTLLGAAGFVIASSFWSPLVEAAPFTRDIGSFMQLGANAGAQSPAGSYATAQTDNVTLELWVFLADTTTAHHAFFNGNGGSSGYGLYLSGGTVNVLMGSVGWIVCSKGASYDVAQNVVLAAGRWTHIAATRASGTGGTDGWRIYVDGQPFATQFNAAGGASGVPLPLNTASYVQIGSATYDPAGLSVSEARIWTRALTQAEIQATMSGTVAANASGLVGYWRFDQGTGTTVADLQTNKTALNLPISGPVTWVESTAGSTAEDTPLTGQLAGGDLTGPVTYLKASDPAHGTVSVDASGAYTYTPAANYNGSDSFSFQVSNGTEVSDPRTVNVTVMPVNDAPVLDDSKSPTLATIAEDTGAPTAGSTVNSTLVSSLVDFSGTSADGSLDNVSDPDSGAGTGIAVIAISNHGTLYYTTDGGTTWTVAPGTLSAGAALLLAADTNTRIAFAPLANLVGTDTDAITFKAWDRTAGSNGDTGVNTGTGSAFSTATDLVPIVITGVNDAPTITAGTYTLTGTDEDTPSSAIQISTIITALGYADADIGASTGIAVTATTTNGRWQYSTDGVTGWTDFGAVSNGAALLLTSGTHVHFVPDGLNGEVATFTFRAWDRTIGFASIDGTPRYGDTTTNGGSSTFSTGTANASIAVSSINDAPAFVGGITTLTVNENTSGNSIKALLHASDPDTSQTLTWTESAAPAHGTLAFSSATASTPGPDITSGGTITYTPTPNYVGSDSFTVQVSDGTATATRTINVTINIAATELRFTTQPTGLVSGAAFTGQPVVAATDSSGRVDPTFTGNVTLSVGSGAGSLSGTLVRPAVAGVATFTDLAYSATADQQAFTLTTTNTAGLTDATSASVTSDVVATKLRFATQPAPLAMASTLTRTFTTAPVVQAVDANNILDTAYAGNVVLSLTASDGTAAPGAVSSVAGTGDTDALPTSVTISATSGVVTFADLSVNYMNSGNPDTLALHATSGVLTAANSNPISSRIDAAPGVSGAPAGASFAEGNPAAAVSVSVAVSDADDGALAWGTVSIIQNFMAGQDALLFTNDGVNMGNIAGTYDAGTGVLTLTSSGATATLAEWTAALRAVKYANTSEQPNPATRTMLFVVNDGYLSSGDIAAARATVTVTGTNDAPTLTGGPYLFDGTNEDTLSSAIAVSTVLAGLTYADLDGSVAAGIAVTATTGNGSWGYSTDGTTWSAMGTVTSTSALLLTSTTQIRYAPNGANGETATITFQGWDQTSGTASTNVTRGLADVSVNGGTTAFSSGTAQASIAVASVNDAPVLTPGIVIYLTGTNEDTTSGANWVSFSPALVDVDSGAISGKAVIATTGRGRWQYSTNGTQWTDFGDVSADAALLLGNSTGVRYVPDGRNGETASFTFRLWDGTSGVASADGTRSLADASTNGGTTSFSANTAVITVNVVSVNDAPTLSGGPLALTGTDEETTSSSTRVSTVLAGVTYADPDSNAVSGIAITATAGRGGWQYSTDGFTWNGVGTVSGTSALLLTATSHVRYAPNGSDGETAAITFRGWDQTSGGASTHTTRGLADASANGGTTGFSTGTAQVTIAVAAVDEPPPSKQSQTITFGALADATLGQTVTLSATASSGLPVSFAIVGGPATLSGPALTTTGVGLVTVRATQSGNSSYDPAPAVERSIVVTAGLPPAPVVPPAIGGSATLTVPGSNSGLAYQWQRNGQSLTGATGATLTLNNVQPPAAGLYTYTATSAAGAGGTSDPVIVGVVTTEKVTGTGEQVGADIRHPNGNVYDQLLLEGSGASFTADPGQVTRMSFVDLSDDIVQVEFSGAGTLSLVMDDAPAGAPAANYNQPGVNYVRGNVGIVITGANETSNVSVFSVGRITAVNQALFRDGVTYDGVANVAFVAIQSTNGKFGGVYTGNVEYFASQGFTGLYAPGVAFAGPVNIGDIQAYDKAQPVLVVGSANNVRIAGGTLAQPNGQPIHVDGLTHVTMAPGQTSQGNPLPAQTNQGVLEQDGVDVTDLLVTAP